MGSSADVNRKARYWVGGLGVLSLITVALVLGKTAREQYHIWRLGSEDLAVSQRAATTLATMGSSRAFPYIVIVIDNAVVRHGIQFGDMSVPRLLHNHPERGEPYVDQVLRPYRESLTKIARESPGAVQPYLRQGLLHDKPHLRALHAYLVREMGMAAKSLVPTLVSLLKDENDKVRLNVIFALMGMEAADTIPALEELATDTNFTKSAVRALRAIGPAGVKSLLKLLQDRDPDVRMQTASTLFLMHRVPDEAIPLLVKALTDDYYPLRVAAAKALGSIGPRAKAAIPALNELLNDRIRQVREAAVEALKSIRAP